MMKTSLYLFIAFCLSCQLAEAALPPLAQSIRELQAILSDQRLTEELTMADIIENVQKLENSYIITTQKHELTVDLNYLPQNMPGPARFELKFNEAVKR